MIEPTIVKYFVEAKNPESNAMADSIGKGNLDMSDVYLAVGNFLSYGYKEITIRRLDLTPNA